MSLTARQTEFADAALRLLAKGGLAAVTFRDVAAEAGWSLGGLQKAYASKDELLRAMFVRLRTARQPAPTAGTARQWLIEYILASLPLDRESTGRYRQHAAFAELATSEDAVARVIAAEDAEEVDTIAGVMTRAQIPDPTQAAWALLAYTRGAAARLLYAPNRDIHARVEYFVDTLR